MLNVLYKYLVLNDHVGIPGVGSFTIQRTNAQVKEDGFRPPVESVLFEPGTALADKDFYHFVAEEEGISDVDAVRKIQDFAYELKAGIRLHQYVELGGIGVLKKNNIGELNLEPVVTRDYFPVITPEHIATPLNDDIFEEEQTHLEEEVTLKKDRWWIWALVLALLALAAIGYFYLQEGAIGY